MMRWIGTTLPVRTSTTSACMWVMKPFMRGVRMSPPPPRRTEQGPSSNGPSLSVMWNGLAAAGAASTATSTIASRSAFRSTADTLLGAGQRPHDARLGATGELHRSEPDEAVRVAEPVARALGDEELVLGLLAERLQPRGGVGGVADRRVLEAPVRADRARNDRPGVDADAHALGLVDQVLLLQPGVEARQAHIEHLARGGERTLGVVGHMDGRAEHGHDAVALERDEGAAVVEHGVAHLVEPAVEDVDDLALQPLG